MKKKDENFTTDFFRDGMSVFLDYISRKLKSDPNYQPHPLVRALECALEGMDKLKVGQSTMGFSSDGTKDLAHNPYLVVLKKTNSGVEVQELRNLIIDKPLPLDVMIIIFRLQIKLDKYPGEKVNPEQMVNALNEVIPGQQFCTIGDRWIEAREKFREQMEAGKVYLPRNEELKKELLSIRYETPWEDYGKNARSIIGTSIISSFNDGKCTCMITSPKSSEIEKSRVFDAASEFMMGQSSEYMKPFGKKEEVDTKT